MHTASVILQTVAEFCIYRLCFAALCTIAENIRTSGAVQIIRGSLIYVLKRVHQCTLSKPTVCMNRAHFTS